jgi:hypothetical protein
MVSLGKSRAVPILRADTTNVILNGDEWIRQNTWRQLRVMGIHLSAPLENPFTQAGSF